MLIRTGLLVTTLLLVPAESPSADAYRCQPTPWAEVGPFYRPGAPLRDRIGSGYLLSGTVRSAADCAPIAGARIEVWQVGPDGRYDDTHRATIYSDQSGRYRLTTSQPPRYGNGKPHIHFVVDAKGFDGVITQHYPQKGKKRATFDLVLAPESTTSGKGRNPFGQRLP